MLPLFDQQSKGLLLKNLANKMVSTKMKVGQYQLHILVEATSGLFSGDKQEALDVIISMQAFGKKIYSQAKSDIGFEETFWGQHFYFQTKFNDPSIADGQKLLISVHNRQKKLFQALIGNYQLSISSIYASKDHCIHHRWLALSNVQKAFSQVVGYIKVSVSMLGENDKAIELETEPITGITRQKNVMIPPSIQRKYYQLSMQIFEGQYIIPADGKTCDPYVGVEFGSLFQKTQPQMKNTNPIWMQTVYVPLSLPAVNQNISLRINDFNYIRKIQVLGSYYINLNTLISQFEAKKKRNRIRQASHGGSKLDSQSDAKTIQYIPQNSTVAINKILPYTQMQWLNFYGPSADASNKQHKNIYQFFPDLAPYYVGSVLLKASITQRDRPQRKVARFKGSLPKQKKIFFQLVAQITAAINLYNKNKPYMLVISVGHFQMQTDYEEAVNGFCCWNVRKTMGISFYENQKVPDIFIYLVDDKGEKVCFLRLPPFPHGMQPSQDQLTIYEPQWTLLKPDLSRIVIQNQEAGYLKIGLKISTKQKKVPSTEKRLKTQFSGLQSVNQHGKVIIQLICAQQLMPLDQQGTSDPFFEFSYMDKIAVSDTKDQTLNPIYFQKLIISSDVSAQPQRNPPIIVNAYDKDKFSREFIGTTFIDIEQGIRQQYIKYGLQQRPIPHWFQIRQNNVLSGKFLASFILLSKQTNDIPPQINMPSQKFVVTLLLLGIRGLKKEGLVNYKNPYIQFDIDSFDAFEFYKDNSSKVKSIEDEKTKATTTQNIITEPRQTGEILNLKIIEKRTIRLPSNPDYWPALSAKIKNQVFQGMYEPILGYFSINLAKSYRQTQKSKEKFEKNSAIVSTKNGSQFYQNPKLRDIDQNLLLSLRNSVLMTLNYQWPVMSKDIELINLKNQFDRYDPSMVVVFPVYQQLQKGKHYQQLYRDILQDNMNYMKIGFDDNRARAKKSLLQRDKHYRFMLNTTLQDYQLKTTGNQIGTFDESIIRTGRMYPSNSIADNLLKKFTEADHYVGKYKGHCFIEKADEVQSQAVTQQQKQRLKKFLRIEKFHMYLYILEGFNLPEKDLLSKSDPYLIVKIGDKVLNFQQQYIDDTDNPQFNKKIYRVIELPDDAIMQIQVWDYDTVLGDDFIGSAIIDLQNRAFYQENNLIFNNPIETHKLMAKQSKIAQGSIRFWLDIIPHNKHSLYRQFEISNQVDSQFEVRVIIWGCQDIPDNDIEGMSDLYVACTFNNETQETDTHVRAVGGTGSFNWRCVFPIKLPTSDTFLSFRVFDQDLLTANDFICSATFSISHILQEAFQTRQPQKLYIGKKDLTKYSADSVSSYRIIDDQKLYDRFEIPLHAKGDVTRKAQDQIDQIGTLQLSIQVIPKALAEKKPSGKGRDSPNQFPFLAEPKDRFQWSWNPIVLMSRLCGRSFRYKLCILLGILFILFLFYNFGHSFGGATAANVTDRTFDQITARR